MLPYGCYIFALCYVETVINYDVVTPVVILRSSEKDAKVTRLAVFVSVCSLGASGENTRRDNGYLFVNFAPYGIVCVKQLQLMCLKGT